VRILPDDKVLDVALRHGLFGRRGWRGWPGAWWPLEQDADLVRIASETLASVGASQVVLTQGSLIEGFAGEAPYDVIFVNGGIESEPVNLIAQLAEGGRLVAFQQIRRAGPCDSLFEGTWQCRHCAPISTPRCLCWRASRNVSASSSKPLWMQAKCQPAAAWRDFVNFVFAFPSGTVLGFFALPRSPPMSSPQHEPTMEEILASIRKIISEDAPEGAAPEAPAATLTPESPRPDGRRRTGCAGTDPGIY